MATYINNLFSQRKGLTTASEIFLKDSMSDFIQNAIINCFYSVFQPNILDDRTKIIERELWIHFLNKNINDFHSYSKVFEKIIESKELWYRKLDVVEFVCRWLSEQSNLYSDHLNDFEKNINWEFERLNYGYRIINHMVMEITSDEEIECIETALNESKDNVRMHIDSAINFYSDKQNPDYRNSIKESITAVEAVCRELTGEDDLNKALKNLNTKGVPIHDRFKEGIRSFYNFTNQPDTGIRHARMKDGYNPSKAEAYFMLVSCSAFVNYLRMISSKS